MSRIEMIETEIQQLSPEELARFRAWFAEFDGQLWDRQLESDVASGRLENLANQALRDHLSGKSTKL